MKLIFDSAKSMIKAPSKNIPAWSRVRNDINRLRKANEVVYTEPEEHPYYPLPFPRGIWEVGMPLDRSELGADGKPKNPYLYPNFIPTDAWQMVATWVVEDGKYVRKTGKLYRDSGYGLHFSTSSTTLGCIRIKEIDDLRWLVQQIQKAKKAGEKVTLEVL